MTWDIRQGDALALLRAMPDESVQCVVTSPPYWGLRTYGTDPQVWGGDRDHAHEWIGAGTHRGGPPRPSHSGSVLGPRGGQGSADAASTRGASAGSSCACGAWLGELGSEPTPALFVGHIVEVLAEVRRVLRRDGTCWINLGDSYARNPGGYQGKTGDRRSRTFTAKTNHRKRGVGLKPKDLVGVPWLVAFALRDAGWHLRCDIVWNKANPMPESVMDRPARSHEYLFLLAASQRYYYDGDAIRTPLAAKTATTFGMVRAPIGDGSGLIKGENYARSVPIRRPRLGSDGLPSGASSRSVWTIASQPFHEAHFATFPPALVEPCILAGSRPGDLVLDPFSGAGTTGLVALRHGRSFLGLELSPAYCEMARRRILADQPLINGPLAEAAR